MMAVSEGTLRGFNIRDVENEEQMAKYIIQYGKTGKKNMQAYPIWETSTSFDVWEKEKKRST